MVRGLYDNPGYRKKFIYFNVGGTRYPRNPAIAKIIRGMKMRTYVRRVGLEGQLLFQRKARKGRRPNPTRNSQTVRVVTAMGARETTKGKVITSLPDRWTARVEAYAPHALAREFGWFPRQAQPGTKLERYRKRPMKHLTAGTKSRRQRAERTLGAMPRKSRSVISTLERRYYRPTVTKK